MPPEMALFGTLFYLPSCYGDGCDNHKLENRTEQAGTTLRFGRDDRTLCRSAAYISSEAF